MRFSIKYVSIFLLWGLGLSTSLFAAPPVRDYIVFEYGLQLGGAHYFGDLNPSFRLNRPSYAAGVWGRYNVSEYIALRATLSHARIGYDDKLYSDAPFMQLRNLNFESDLWEFAVQGDFNFYSFIPRNENYFFTAYVTLGIGMFHFDPYTYLNDQKYFLRTLGTEGQDVSEGKVAYNNIDVCFPIGVGMKFNIGRYVNIGCEFGYRLLITDYLDDVSLRYAGMNAFTPGSPASLLQDRSIEIPNQRTLGVAGKQRGDTYQMDGYAFATVSISFNIIRTPECPEDNGFKYEYKRSKKYYRNPKADF